MPHVTWRHVYEDGARVALFLSCAAGAFCKMHRPVPCRHMHAPFPVMMLVLLCQTESNIKYDYESHEKEELCWDGLFCRRGTYATLATRRECCHIPGKTTRGRHHQAK